MLPEIAFFSAKDVFVTGLGAKPDGGQWSYYLPFKRVGRAPFTAESTDPHVHYALPVSDTRVVVATQRGDLALIDLAAERVVARAQVPLSPPMLQISRDGRFLHVQDERRICVLDAETLQLVHGPARRSGFLSFAQATAPDAGKTAPREAPWSGSPPDRTRQALQAPSYPPDGPAGFRAVLAAEAMVTLTLADGGIGAALAVLEELAARMEHDLDALILCNTITLRFVLDGQEIPADTFFDRFVQTRSAEAVPLLRRILLAYLNGIEGGEGGMPWNLTGQSFQALRALLLLDANSLDIYRLYIDKGDLEHDDLPFGFFAAYVRRHGVRGEADIRFGIHMTLLGCQTDWVDPAPLLAGAARLLTAERFAAMVTETVAAHGDAAWPALRGAYAAYLERHSTTAFTREVIALLQAAGPPDTDRPPG